MDAENILVLELLGVVSIGTVITVLIWKFLSSLTKMKREICASLSLAIGLLFIISVTNYLLQFTLDLPSVIFTVLLIGIGSSLGGFSVGQVDKLNKNVPIKKKKPS